MKIFSNLAYQANTAATSLNTTGNINTFFLKPVKVFSEFLSALGTYESVKSLSSFTFLSELTAKTKDTLDGTLGILGLLKFTLNAPASLLQLKVDNLLKCTLGAVFDLKDAQDVFTKSAKWPTLTYQKPFSLVSKILNWKISPERLLLIGGFTGAWQIVDSCKSITNWSSVTNLKSMENRNWNDVSHALTIAETVANFSYSCFKVLGNSSRAHSWAKFALLAAATSIKIAAAYTKPSEKQAPSIVQA